MRALYLLSFLLVAIEVVLRPGPLMNTQQDVIKFSRNIAVPDIEHKCKKVYSKATMLGIGRG